MTINFKMQTTSFPTTKAAKCPNCGKYHALVESELYDDDLETKSEFDKAARLRGYKVVDTTTKDAKDNFADDCLKPKTLF